jgi:hypothetical protein
MRLCKLSFIRVSNQTLIFLSWSQILPTAGAMVANQAQVFGQIIDFYLDPGQEHPPGGNQQNRETKHG